VGREVVSVLMPPRFATVDAMTGTEVKGSGGESVGTIDQMMLDPAHGYVAYVLLEREGFLESGARWTALPFQVLKPSATDASYRLSVPLSQVQRIESMPKSDLPTMVSRADLERLYRNYDVTPYWQQMRPTE
jgi:hypothetical protein